MKESVIRTLVPVIYALLVRFGLGEWLGLDDAALREFVTVITTGLVYVTIRVAERHKASFGWLLGSPTPPKYE